MFNEVEFISSNFLLHLIWICQKKKNDGRKLGRGDASRMTCTNVYYIWDLFFGLIFSFCLLISRCFGVLFFRFVFWVNLQLLSIDF
jgi:hypothetical protein